MFLKQLDGNTFKFVSITSFSRINVDKQSQTNRDYRLQLANNTFIDKTLTQAQWQILEAPLENNGFTID